MRFLLLCICVSVFCRAMGQNDSLPLKIVQVDTNVVHTTEKPMFIDTSLRIINLNPYFTIHVDSILNYDLIINRELKNYFWYLRNGPVGIKIDKNSGNLYFKADKAYFKSGRLKYDQPYKVNLGVQNLHDPTDNVDTSFTILFYSTEINPSRLKPSATGLLFIEEGDSIKFTMQCEEGTFPFEQINLNTNMPISNFTPVRKCGDIFVWTAPFGIFKEGDTSKQKLLQLDFIGADKFYNKDTASIKVVIKPGINYPVRNTAHKKVSGEMSRYIQNLKLSFYVLSKSVKSNRTTRTTFDITGTTTALAGTVISTTASSVSATQFGKILPSVGLTLVPVKEAVAPNKIQEQNTATQIRSEAKRLEYFLGENALVGDRDAEVLAKTKRLQDELKKSRLQFVDLPMVEFDANFSEEDAERYFRDPKVNKKYKLKLN